MTSVFFDKDKIDEVLPRLWEQCESEELCDIVFIAGNEKKRIPAHRNILSVASDHFYELVTSSISKEVEITNVDGGILSSLVEYCYTGRLVISEDNATELFRTAHMLRLSSVVDASAKFLEEHLNPSNCFGIEILAERYHCETLLRKCKDYNKKQLHEIYERNEVLTLNVEQLSKLLASDDLYVESEEHVFNSLMTWIEQDKYGREQHKAELLKLIRMPLLEQTFLKEHVKPFCIESPDCLQMYIEAIENHSTADNKMTKPRTPFQFLMGVTLSDPYINKMYIHYYAAQRHKWMKCLKELEYRTEFGLAVAENELFIIGGYSNETEILNSVICLSLSTMTLRQLAPMHEYRANCSAAFLNGCVYVVGGWNRTNHSSSMEKWDPKTNKWDKVAFMAFSRKNFGIGVLNDKLYVVGGDLNDEEINTAECYDPRQNVWENIAPMSESHLHPGVTVANGLLYAVGGYRKTVERYDPKTNEWTAICSLNEEFYCMTLRCITLRDKVVVCCNDRFEEYNALTNEWKEIVPLTQLGGSIGIFTYSNKLLKSEFVEN